MAEGVRGNSFLDFGSSRGFLDGFLEGGFVDVVALGDACAGVLGKVWGGEEVLPQPVAMGIGIFFFEGVGEIHGAKTFGEVLLVGGLHLEDVPAQGGNEAVGEHGEAVVAAFAVADDDLVVVEIHIFDAHAETFHKAQSAAVEDLGHEFVNAVEAGDNGAGLLFGENGGDAFVFLGTEGEESGFVERDLKDVSIKEEDGAEGLVLGGFGDFSFDDKVGDELVDLADSHLIGMNIDLAAVEVGVMITDKFANPVQVGFFGAGRILFEADLVAVEIEEFFRRHGWFFLLRSYAILAAGLDYFTRFVIGEAVPFFTVLKIQRQAICRCVRRGNQAKKAPGSCSWNMATN